MEMHFKIWLEQDNLSLKDWFGNSKVKRNGVPLVMYHGTRKGKAIDNFDISSFQRNEPLRGGEGFYFTDSKDYAYGYTRDLDTQQHDWNRVGEYYIRMEDPAPEKLVDDWKRIIWTAERYPKAAEGDYSPPKNRQESIDAVKHWAKKMREDLIMKGYDGYIAVGKLPDNLSEIVVFSSEQIRPVSSFRL